MSEYHAGNRYLSDSEMKTNAKFIYSYLSPRGWSINSIAGMLGNMQVESTINPAIWENLTYDESKGYGLVQWTPATKFLSWCGENRKDYQSMEANLDRIIYEQENNIQWIPTAVFPMSFSEFKTSTMSAAYLATVFLANYERPADSNQPERGEYATAWYNYLLNGGSGDTGGGDDTGGGTATKSKKMPLWLILKASRRF